MAKAPKSSQAPDTSLVKALANILDDAGLAELEYETEAVSVRLSRVSGAAAVAPVTAIAAPAAVPAAAPVAADPRTNSICRPPRRRKIANGWHHLHCS